MAHVTSYKIVSFVSGAYVIAQAYGCGNYGGASYNECAPAAPAPSPSPASKTSPKPPATPTPAPTPSSDETPVTPVTPPASSETQQPSTGSVDRGVQAVSHASWVLVSAFSLAAAVLFAIIILLIRRHRRKARANDAQAIFPPETPREE